MEQEISGTVQRGLAKMLPRKFGNVEKETPTQERREGKAHEATESAEYEKREHQMMRKGK